MIDTARIEDLKRRLEHDPASIAFAQLAEEYRRAGLLHDAVHTCRAGLVTHPTYLSARVTLGRALLELERLDEARVELSRVLDLAPDHLAATRALADVYRHAGDDPAARRCLEAAQRLAPNDPEIERGLTQLRDTPAAGAVAHLSSARARAVATVAALEGWLEAIHAARADRRA